MQVKTAQWMGVSSCGIFVPFFQEQIKKNDSVPGMQNARERLGDEENYLH